MNSYEKASGVLGATCDLLGMLMIPIGIVFFFIVNFTCIPVCINA